MWENNIIVNKYCYITIHALCEGNINDDLNKVPTLLATDFEIT